MEGFQFDNFCKQIPTLACDCVRWCGIPACSLLGLKPSKLFLSRSGVSDWASGERNAWCLSKHAGETIL